MKHRQAGCGAECILWLHGGNVAGWMWGPQVPSFSDFTNLVPDFPGFGQSAGNPWESITATADECASLLGESPAHVVGLSLGASVGIALAARHPHLVSSLVVSSTQVVPPRRRDRVAARLMLTAWDRRWFWTGTAASYGLRDEDAELFVETGLGIERSTAEAVVREVSAGIPTSILAEVRAPTLAVAGEKDSVTITRDSLELASRVIPDVTTAIAPGMHHQWNVEAPELFTDAVRHWITSRNLASGLRATMEPPPHPVL